MPHPHHGTLVTASLSFQSNLANPIHSQLFFFFDNSLMNATTCKNQSSKTNNRKDQSKQNKESCEGTDFEHEESLTLPLEGAMGTPNCTSVQPFPRITPFLRSTMAREMSRPSYEKEDHCSINVLNALRNIKVKSVNEP